MKRTPCCQKPTLYYEQGCPWFYSDGSPYEEFSIGCTNCKKSEPYYFWEYKHELPLETLRELKDAGAIEEGLTPDA